MTDFNKEFETLQEYINYRVDWYTSYVIYGKCFYIDVLGMPKAMTVKGIYETYIQMGLMYVNNEPKVTENNCLTFEEFKQTL